MAKKKKKYRIERVEILVGIMPMLIPGELVNERSTSKHVKEDRALDTDDWCQVKVSGEVVVKCEGGKRKRFFAPCVVTETEVSECENITPTGPAG